MARHKKLVVEEKLTKPSAVAPMLFVGLGGCGCRMVSRVARHLHRRPDWKERYSKLTKFALVDTNINDLEAEREVADETFLISDFEKEEYANLASGKSFLEADPYFTQWVPKDYRFRAGDTAGAGQIRIESRLGLFYQMKHRDFLPRLRRLLEDLKSHELGHRRLDSQELRIVLCYSVAGGTGSGCHLPLAYVLHDLAHDLGKPRMIGVSVMPAVFQDKTGINKDGTFANGYASLKEAEHLMKLGAPDSRFYPEDGYTFHYNPADESKTTVRQKPFEFIYVLDKPQSFSVENVVQAAADGLYLQFFSPLFTRQASDYDNYTQHQRFLVPHDFEGKGILGFSTFYGSYGAAVLLVPVPGLVDYCSQASALSLMQASFLRDVPGDPTYQPLRTNPEPFHEVTEKDGGNEKPVHVSEFHDKQPTARETLLDRMFMKRVRLLAACERNDNVEKRFLALFRHGHRVGERPDLQGEVDFVEDQATADRKLLTDHGMEFSIGAVVLEALAGARPGRMPGLLEAAKEAIHTTRDENMPHARKAEANELLHLVKSILPDLRSNGVRILEEGYKKGTLAHPGFDSLIDLQFLREEAGAVELAAKRYAVVSVLDQVNWEQLTPDVPEVQIPEDVRQGRNLSDDDARDLLRRLMDQAVARAMAQVQRRFTELLGDLKVNLSRFASVQRTLDLSFEDVERDAQRRLASLREQGDESANRYVLDAEALQMEDGRRLWDFYYQDRVSGLPELSLRDKDVQQVLSDTVADLAVTGSEYAVGNTNSATLEKLFTSLRQHAGRVLQARIDGDPHSADRQRREGLTLAEALELEVVYRALYLSNDSEVDQDGLKAVRRLIAEYRALPPDRQVHLDDTRHQDYLRDKIKRVVKEKASVLCVYDDSRDQHGGVRPDDVFLAAIDQDFTSGTIEEALRKTDIAGLEWVSEGWHNPKEIIFYRAILNVPLYVFGRLGEMKHDYYRFRNLSKRPKVLHIDDNWETGLPDLDPDSSQEEHRQKLVRQQIVNFAALLRIPRGEEPDERCIVRRDGLYWLCTPGQKKLPANGSSPGEGLVPLGESMTSAIANLPEVLDAEAVKYLPYKQMLHAVREGMVPEVLLRITRLPFLWRRNHDELKQQYGSNPTPTQRERLKDYNDSYNRLRESLDMLLDRLSNRQIEHRTLGDGESPRLGDLPEDPSENLNQSIEFLRAFSETWKSLDNPERGGEIPETFIELFKPLDNERLVRSLERLRHAFGTGDGNGSGSDTPSPIGSAASGSEAPDEPSPERDEKGRFKGSDEREERPQAE